MTKRVADLELGLIGNCEVAALVDERGSVAWACMPRMDGDPVFCALLNPDRGLDAEGCFAIELRDCAESTQSYLRNSAILETVLRDGHGHAVRIRDFSPRFHARGRIFRPAMLVRIVEPVEGRPVIRVRVQPRCDYGSAVPRVSRGSHHLSFHAPRASFRLTTNASLSVVTQERLHELDEPIAFILGPDTTVEEHPVALAHTFLRETRAYWQDWIRGLAIPFEWQQAVIRAAISLKLCTYEDTGAIVAAVTTSIPEAPDTGRNWDYRYCWIRDSYFTIHALNRLGATRTMEGYLRYFKQVFASGDVADLHPLYAISGDADVAAQVVPGLSGYRGMGPVHVGNGAYRQTQLDVYGALILASSQSFFDERLASPGDPVLFARLEALGSRAAEVYEQPDSGPWEFRGEQRVHTFSAVMCWAGCDRLARIAGRLGLEDRAAHWRGLADAMRVRILARAWSDERKSFVGSFGGTHLDATALLLPELGIVAADDPRFRATLAAIERELRDGDLIYRYRHPDDFGKPATAFTVCSFWYANALAAVGRIDEARGLFERLLARRTRLGLLSEDIAPDSGELWGNFPQTYSLVGIVNGAVRLSRSWEDAT